MEGGSTGGHVHEGRNVDGNSHAIVEIKIKTLDSQVYTCQVERNMPVPALKEQVASLTGVPAQNQRLICRGKVLKDEHILSAYDVEDGHTLHLVTRQAPPLNPPSTSIGVSRSEDQVHLDSHPFTSRNRPGQVSHSVVLGTFNIPDHGDGALPDVNRILSSVLSSLGIGNLVPMNAGATSGGGATATVPPTRLQQTSLHDVQGREEAGSGRAQAGVDHQSPAMDQGGSGDMEPQNDSVPGLRPGVSFVGGIPAALPQLRLVQQAMVVPDALTTLSQYLNRMEQVFAANGQQVNQVSSSALNSSPQTQSSGLSQQTDHQQTAVRGHGAPATLGAIIRRTQDLLSNQAGTELARLAAQLENEPNLNTATARGEVQSAALRDGILMQHLGALLLELGRTTLTLRMGSSSAESAVNAGPAVFISASGPNPMMVQPLPFQPGTGLGALTGTPPQAATGSGVPVNSNETPRNINIHIHAGDMGIPSAFSSISPLSPPLPQPNQSVMVSTGPSMGFSTIDTRGSHASQSQSMDIPNRAASGSTVLSMQPVLGPMQGGPVGLGEHGTVRVLPMRTLVAAVPASLHARPPTEAAGAGMGVFYPLLARFQQLNPAQFSQQFGLSHTAVVNDGHPLLPGGTVSAHQQSPFPVPHPTVRAQVQVQAWVPSGGQAGDGQGGSRPTRVEGELQIPFTSSADGSPSLVQEQQGDGTGSSAGAAGNSVQSAAGGQSENGNHVVSEIFRGLDVEGLVRPILQAVEDYTQSGVGRRDQPQSEQGPVPHELAGQVDGIDVAQRRVSQEALKSNAQEAAEIEQSNYTSSNAREMTQSESLVVHSAMPTVTAASSSGEPKEVELKDNQSVNVPPGLDLDGFQPLPSRKRSHKEHHPQMSAGTSGLVSEDQMNGSPSRVNETASTSSRGNMLQDFFSNLVSRTEVTGGTALGAGQAPQELSHIINHDGNSEDFSGGGGTSMGDVMSHLLSNWLPGNLLQADRSVDLRTLLSSGGLGSTMGQVTQSPLMRNARQQVGDDGPDVENMLSQSLGGHGAVDFGGILQQMMPIASQVQSGVTPSASEHTLSPMHDTELRPGVEGGTVEEADPPTGSESWKQTQSQDESVTVDTELRHLMQPQRPASDANSGGVPVIKRQKTQ